MKKAPPLENIPKHFDPKAAEERWYPFWNEKGYFHSEPDDREPYTIVIPPPNVTGVLHMGHILNNAIQDVLVRRARMMGFNACWVPGTDHASIATEAKIVQKLRDEGTTKADISRDQFMQHAWNWTNKHGGIILDQLKKLGASCDWNRTRFTLEEELYDSVIDCFIDLYENGYIYRGKRMINWDPEAKTALSDEEVIYRQVNSKFYYVRYKIENEDDWLTIATTRPETILADTAVCVHPEDDRHQHLIGKTALVPVVERPVPIIADEYVDPEFGTGCLKITPAHDPNDYELGQKHHLEVIDILNKDGSLNKNARHYIGEDRFKARKRIVEDLNSNDQLVNVEEITNKIGYSERTNAIIEPRLSLQWFCRMDKLSKPALDNVLNDNVRFHPPKFKNAYRHWMENIRDWCISRQLWWGHRIPAWYFGESKEDFVIAKSEEEAIEKARQKSGNDSLSKSDLHQDEDVLDTWFSAWLWPITVFDGIKDPDNEDINYYYPTNDLVTAPEIMFFWVARMIISGYYFRGNKPFRNVYYTGIVRDKQRRKMSKSLGNSPDPLELISKYGADGVRVGMLFSSPAGNDLLFEESLCEQGRNFANKIWNAFRFLAINLEEGTSYDSELKIDSESLVDRWINSRINETIMLVDRDFSSFRINEALKKIYSLIWDDFCDWYIELIKPDSAGLKIPTEKLSTALNFFEQLLKLLHPFMPFLTEEIWQMMREREKEDALIIADWPEYDENNISESDISLFSQIQKMISALRNIRAEFNVPNGTEIDLLISTDDRNMADQLDKNQQIFRKLQSVNEIIISTDLEQPPGSASSVIGGTELYVPLKELIDIDKEKERIQKEISRLEGFLTSVHKKLDNEQFLNNAPKEVVQKEKKKKTDTETDLNKLKRIVKDLG